MASLCAAHPTQTHLIQCFNPITKAKVIVVSSSIKLPTRVSQSCFSPRFKNAVRSHVRERSFVVFASDSSPSGGDSTKDKSDGKSDATQGPPFLTILAGLFVFFAICWFFGSIIMWLFGLIVNVARLK